jgi:hypothetical protein
MLKFGSNSPRCSFEVILFILKLEAKRRNYKRLETITINHLKIIIAQFYIDTIDKQYTEGIKDRFAKLLKYYGMESIADEYRIKFIANEDDNFIETLPFFESYHLTRLDIWILASYYEIPIIILYYPNKALLETKDKYSILTTYYDEKPVEQEEFVPPVSKEKEGSDEDLPYMGEEARPIVRKLSPNVQGYYFIIAPAIKPNTVPSYSIIYRKQLEGNVSELTDLATDNEYYIPLNILTQSFQSVVIHQQSTLFVNPDEVLHSEDDESAQMKESIRYKNSIIQFVQNFKPPSKKGKSDDSSSVGTAQSLELQDEQDLGQLLDKKKRKHKNPSQKINISSPLLTSLGKSMEPASQVESDVLESDKLNVKAKTKAKATSVVKGKKPTINVSSIVIPPSDSSNVSMEPSAASSKPVKKTKKKINIDTSTFRLLENKKDSSEEARLTDIPEEGE